jgi:peptidoglycan/LPS O-acetylase OafA/YrhL
MKRIPSLDGLRGVAVLYVFLAHIGLENWFNGHLAVSLFFVLSGYLLTTIFLDEFSRTGTVNFARFYKRRVLRILPPLYLCFALMFLTSALIDGVYPWRDAVWVTSLIPNYRNAYFGFEHPSQWANGSGPLWTLGVEEHFYLVFPLLFLVFMRRSKRAFVITSAVMSLVLVALAVVKPWGLAGVPPLGDAEMAFIFGGSITAACVSRRPPVWSSVKAFLLLVGLIFIAVFAEHNWKRPIVFSAMIVPTALVFGQIVHMAAHHSKQVSFRWLSFRPLVYIGKRSYVFYLIHALVLDLAQRVSPTWRVPIAFSASIVFAEMVYRAVEKPLSKLFAREGA